MVDLNVALGLEDPPADYNYSELESIDDVVNDESREVVKRKRVVYPQSNDDGLPDCVIVDVIEKGCMNKVTLSQFGNEENVECYVPNVQATDGEKEKCGVDDNDIPSKDPKIEDDGGDDDKTVPFTGQKIEDDGGDDDKDVPFTEPKIEDDSVNDVPLKVPKKEKDADEKKDSPSADRTCDRDDESLRGRMYAASVSAKLEGTLQIGCEFPDLERVYLLYCEYSRFKGFSVRKGEQRYFGKSTNIRWKEFLCSCTGFPNYRGVKNKIGAYKKLVFRTNCNAKLTVSRDDLGSFVVTMFEKEHNHPLVDDDQTFMLRSSRHMSYAKKSVLEALHSAGIGVTKAFNFMSKESGGVQNVGFTKKDAYHHMDRVRLQTKVEDGDARLLLDYFSKKSTSDPYYFCRYQLDDDGRLMNIFFRDNRCAVDYDAFGDVLSVDTTYQTNKYNMICAPFVGINHHTRNVMFGMAMLSDETTGTFKWLFETFLESMYGKQPKVVFTDQCRAMMNAIDVIFPNSRHRLCQWHIMKNCSSNFGKLQGDPAFKSLWYRCMNIVETEEDFETTWKEMMENYEIPNQSWFDGMYNLREKWSCCFSRGIFTAGLLATSRSELTNKVLKDVVRSTVALSTFVVKYEDILNSWRSTERTDDAFGIWKPGHAISHSGLLQKAAAVFTCTIYRQFEHDYGNCITLIVEPTIGDQLPNNIIKYTSKGREFASIFRTTLFNTVTHDATCNCGKWETEGLICRHILRAFVNNEGDDIPDSMIYRRWTKIAKDVNILAHENPKGESAIIRHMTFGNEFMRHMSEIVSTAMQYAPLRLRLVQRMKEVTKEFSDMMWNYVASEEELKPTHPLTVPLFRDPRKICPRGFANVRESNPSKGRKRAAKAAPKSVPGRKAKVDRTSTPRTQQFMPGDPVKTQVNLDDDIDDILPLTL